jgi:hypothetical protein
MEFEFTSDQAPARHAFLKVMEVRVVRYFTRTLKLPHYEPADPVECVMESRRGTRAKAAGQAEVAFRSAYSGN